MKLTSSDQHRPLRDVPGRHGGVAEADHVADLLGQRAGEDDRDGADRRAGRHHQRDAICSGRSFQNGRPSSTS